MEPSDQNPYQVDNSYPNNPNFRPRKTLMVVIGIFVILTGLLTLGIAVFYGAVLPAILSGIFNNDLGGTSEEMLEKMNEVPIIAHLTPLMIAVGIGIGLHGIGLIWMGFGSIAARRWSAKLLHALGWFTIGMAGLQLVGQLMTIPMMMSMMDSAQAAVSGASGGAAIGGGEMAMMLVQNIIGMVVGVISVAGPGVLLVVIYGRKNIEFTTHQFDSSSPWTEKVSFKVLVLWLLYVSSILWMIPTIFVAVPAAVDMNLIGSSTIGYAVLGGVTLILIVLAIGVSKGAMWSWWASVIYLIANSTFGYLYFSSLDLMEVLGGMFGGAFDLNELREEEDFDQIFDVTTGTVIRYSLISGFVTLLIIVGYLFYIRKDFGPQQEEPVEQ